MPCVATLASRKRKSIKCVLTLIRLLAMLHIEAKPYDTLRVTCEREKPSWKNVLFVLVTGQLTAKDAEFGSSH